ncbi:glycosyltransferase family 4 protein [bacterium]|nr:glycosyltransferase family 4 protein [bacterium]
MMKVLLLTAYFPPEIGSASHLFYELAESLAKKYMVTVITGFPRYNVDKKRMKDYKGKFIIRELVAGIRVIRLRIPLFSGSIPVFKGLNQFITALFLFFAGLFFASCDLILLYSPPLPLGLSGYFLGKIKKSYVGVNVQDLFPQSAIDLGVLKNKYLIKFFKTIEKFIYKKADFITVHSPGNKKHVINKGAGAYKVTVIPNWADTDLINPSNRSNRFRKEHFLDNRFVVSFVGVMGYSQDMEVIIESALQLRDCEKILFLLVGGGIKKAGLEKKVKVNNLRNVKFLPFQPREKYPSVLAASDVCLVTLKEEVKTPVVPSKIVSIMSSARPFIAGMNFDSDAICLIKEAGCGLCVEPGNSQMLTQAIMKLYNSRSLRNELSKKGRMYAQQYFSRDICIAKYEKVFKEIFCRGDV